MVLHRMIVLNSSPSERNLPQSVYLAPNGEPFRKILQLDFNSLVRKLAEFVFIIFYFDISLKKLLVSFRFSTANANWTWVLLSKSRKKIQD